MIKKIKKIGILGGTFDPCHMGHLKISKEAKKIFNLKKVIWVITKKNPLKQTSKLSLEKRLKISKNFTKKFKFIQVKHFEKIINSRIKCVNKNIFSRLNSFLYKHLHLVSMCCVHI